MWHQAIHCIVNNNNNNKRHWPFYPFLLPAFRSNNRAQCPLVSTKDLDSLFTNYWLSTGFILLYCYLPYMLINIGLAPKFAQVFLFCKEKPKGNYWVGHKFFFGKFLYINTKSCSRTFASSTSILFYVLLYTGPVSGIRQTLLSGLR